MLRLTKAPNIAIAALWVDALRHAGIEASMQRYYLSSVAGELPPDQCLPEVWVMHEEQEAQARALLRDLAHVPQRRWHCVCGELVEGGFEQCWNCGEWMPR
jgi:Putative prokaryotic signal transducing protein